VWGGFLDPSILNLTNVARDRKVSRREKLLSQGLETSKKLLQFKGKGKNKKKQK